MTPRDLDLLTLVGLTRGITTDQIARMLFPSGDRARRRIRRLFDARLVDVTLTSSSSPNLVTLTRYGRDELLGFRPLLTDRVVVARPPAPHAVHHHLLVVELRLWLTQLQRRGVIEGLVVESPVRDLGPWRTHRLVPDGVATLGVEGDAYAVALEADRGTEGAVVLEDKLGRYVNALAVGAADGLVIASVSESTHRIATLAQGVGLARSFAIMPSSRLRGGDPSALGQALQRSIRAL